MYRYLFYLLIMAVFIYEANAFLELGLDHLARKTIKDIQSALNDMLMNMLNLSRQQMKNSLKMLKKTCMGKNDVTEELIGDIEKGKFIEDKGVMCYIACIYQMSQIIKNNKLSYEATIKQIDLMYPPELKKPVKIAVEKCKDVSSNYKDICEASFWSAKCMYEADPKNFVFA